VLIEQARSSGRGFRTHLKAILLAAPTAVSRALTMTVTRIAGCVEYQASKNRTSLGSTPGGVLESPPFAPSLGLFMFWYSLGLTDRPLCECRNDR
jgi:hypothetical protein